MMVTPARASAAFAALLALFAINLPSHIIDIFGLPIPPFVFGMSWMTFPTAIALAVLWPLLRADRQRLFSLGDLAVVGTLALWTLLEMRHPVGPLRPWTLPLTFVPVWVASVAVRGHLRAFRQPEMLVTAFVAAVSIFGFVHLSSLIASRVIAMPGVRVEELIDRNSISMLIVAAVWVMLFRAREHRQPSWRLVGLILLAEVHARVNHARGPELLLLFGVGLRLVSAAVPSRRLTTALALSACAAIFVLFSFAKPVLTGVGGIQAFGGGDSASSTRQRVETNWDLIRRVSEAPLGGLGWNSVLFTRSEGSISHSLFLVILASYGILGVLPFLALAFVWLLRGPPDARPQRSVAIVLVFATSALANDPLVWFGIVLALFATDVEAEPHSATVAAQRSVSLQQVLRAAGQLVPAGAAVAVAFFLGLAAFLLLRPTYVITAPLEIGLVGIVSPQGIEAPSETEELVTQRLRHNVAIIRACSVRGATDRLVLTIACEGRTEAEARRRTQDVAAQVIGEHRIKFEIRVRAANAQQIARERERDVLSSLIAAVPGIPELTRVLSTRLGDLRYDIQRYDAVRARHRHSAFEPDRMALRRRPHGNRAVAIAFVLALMAAAAFTLSLGTGEALVVAGRREPRPLLGSEPAALADFV